MTGCGNETSEGIRDSKKTESKDLDKSTESTESIVLTEKKEEPI